MSEYRVAGGPYADFHKEVSDLLANGFVPVGGVAVHHDIDGDGDPYTFYYQAMFREEKRKE